MSTIDQEMKMMKQLTQKIGLAILASLVVLTACSGLGTKATPTPQEEQIQDYQQVVSATGLVLPEKRATLSVSTAGIIAEVLVEKGDAVEEGLVVVRLKGQEEIQAAIAAAEFELLSAEQALDDLYDTNDVALAASLRAVAQTSNAVKDAKWLLDNFTIPTNQQDMTAVEAMESMRKTLDEARAAFEPYKNESYLNEAREKLKEDVDQAQSDYNASVKRLTYEFQLAESEAQLAEALEDYQTLLKGPDPKLVSLAEARLENARAALAAAESQLEDLEIKAPFSGTIGEVYIREGEWVSPGSPLVLMADLQHLRVETTDLNEIDVAQVEVGDQAVVTFDALPGVELQGTVRLISPKASEGSGVNYTVILEIPDFPDNLRWGMTAFVDILLDD
jgi:HlyD family secretion protein